MNENNGIMYWDVYFNKTLARSLTHKEWGDINILIDRYLKENGIRQLGVLNYFVYCDPKIQ